MGRDAGTLGALGWGERHGNALVVRRSRCDFQRGPLAAPTIFAPACRRPGRILPSARRQDPTLCYVGSGTPRLDPLAWAQPVMRCACPRTAAPLPVLPPHPDRPPP